MYGNENLWQLLEVAKMDGYAAYTKEDLIDFAMVAIEDALFVVDMPRLERNEIREHYGMEPEPAPASMIGLVSTRDWTK